MKSLYFAHPIKTYATPEALEVLRALHEEYPNYKIIDPEDLNGPTKWVACRQCMDEHMAEIFFPAIKECEIFAIWAPVATCGIECELHYAWLIGKPCVHISYFAGEIEFEDLTLQEYHKAESAMEVR